MRCKSEYFWGTTRSDVELPRNIGQPKKCTYGIKKVKEAMEK